MKTTEITWIDLNTPPDDYNMSDDVLHTILDHMELIPKEQKFRFGFDDDNTVYLELEGESEIVVIKSSLLKALEDIQKKMDEDGFSFRN